MRYIVLVLFLLVLSACAPSLESTLRERADVKLFFAMVPDATYAQSAFSQEQAQSVKELMASECPAVDGAFVRSTFKGDGASLVLYSSSDGATVHCVLFRPDVGNVSSRAAGDAPQGVFMVINGEQIAATEVKNRLDALPESVPRDQAALSAVLESLINDVLLRQQASTITVSDADLLRVRSRVLEQLDVTEEDLPALLAQQQLTREQFDDMVLAQTRVDILARTRLLAQEINVSDESLREAYLQNPNQFLQGEQATMRSIFLSAQQRTGEQVQERTLEVVRLLNVTDFCELVREYSDDVARKEQCGMFVIPRGVVDPALERASFSTPQGQTAVVQTSAGTYLVQTMRVDRAQVLPFDQVASQMRAALVNQELQGRLALYLGVLRGRAQIVTYLE